MTVGTAPVRYQPNADNTVLRDVLHRLWDYRCYACGTPKDFTDAQIDHLIARNLTPANRATVLHGYGLPPKFDLDRPANLAPICGDCNRKKSNHHAPTITLILGMHLGKARKLEPRVDAAVRGFAAGNRIGSYLRRVNADSLHDSPARTAFLRHAPAIVQKLALTDPASVDFFTADRLHVDLEYLAVPVALTLNQRGRTAMTVLAEIIGCPLVDALRSGVHTLVGAVAEQARGSIEGVNLPNGPVNAEEPQCDDLDLTIDEVDFSRANDELTITFDGAFSGHFSGSVVFDAPGGDGLMVSSADSEVAGRFALWASWQLGAAGGPPAESSAEVTHWARSSVLI
ncbi:HNH endonuclease [Micromonospora sp. A3M-1-15]|uniref:HNH endonuclease n=1 Tax=Micromonospora sp. A3M-1-15 TaxID=2962035 RepID=UPI0020B7B830|nr:HNH endonuclease signature motif containing protein [Micromonospora sp. A3M-1-15]MCP3785279.1 HNH endonuclease [Micromonospora sp. A3M-1-15]